MKKLLERKGLIPDEKGRHAVPVFENLNERGESKVLLNFNLEKIKV